MITFKWYTGVIHVDWTARDAELRRQFSTGVFNMEKLIAAAVYTWRPR